MADKFKWEDTKQLSLRGMLAAFFLPSAFGFVGFHLVLPHFFEKGVPDLIAWPVIASFMFVFLISAAVYLLKKEAKKLNVSFLQRVCARKLSGKEWGKSALLMLAVIIIMFVGMSASVLFINAIDFKVPDYMPFFLDPQIDPMKADPATLSEGYDFKGKHLLFVLMAVTLLLNIITEEIYFRAWIMPKLMKYGAWAWVINGTLFAFYHTFQLWLLPAILAASLGIAFLFYKTKSIWPIFVLHLTINGLNLIGIWMLIMG